MRANYKVCIIVIIIWNYNFTCVNEFQMYSISFIRENEILIRFNPLTFLFHIIDFNLKRINLYPHKEWFFYNYIFFNNAIIALYIQEIIVRYDNAIRTERTLIQKNNIYWRQTHTKHIEIIYSHIYNAYTPFISHRKAYSCK